MKFRAMCVGLAMMWGGSVAWADVYRCTGADGKTIYQQSPCTSGSQKAVDDSSARAKQRAEVEKREAEARDAEREATSSDLDGTGRERRHDACQALHGVGRRVRSGRPSG